MKSITSSSCRLWDHSGTRVSYNNPNASAAFFDCRASLSSEFRCEFSWFSVLIRCWYELTAWTVVDGMRSQIVWSSSPP